MEGSFRSEEHMIWISYFKYSLSLEIDVKHMQI